MDGGSGRNHQAGGRGQPGRREDSQGSDEENHLPRRKMPSVLKEGRFTKTGTGRGFDKEYVSRPRSLALYVFLSVKNVSEIFIRFCLAFPSEMKWTRSVVDLGSFGMELEPLIKGASGAKHRMTRCGDVRSWRLRDLCAAIVVVINIFLLSPMGFDETLLIYWKNGGIIESLSACVRACFLPSESTVTTHLGFVSCDVFSLPPRGKLLFHLVRSKI